MFVVSVLRYSWFEFKYAMLRKTPAIILSSFGLLLGSTGGFSLNFLDVDIASSQTADKVTFPGVGIVYFQNPAPVSYLVKHYRASALKNYDSPLEQLASFEDRGAFLTKDSTMISSVDSAVPIPEPSVLGLGVMGGLALMKRCRD